MADVRLTLKAQKDLDGLPVTIRLRTVAILARLRDWPQVSGAKPLTGRLAGRYRMRTGA